MTKNRVSMPKKQKAVIDEELIEKTQLNPEQDILIEELIKQYYPKERSTLGTIGGKFKNEGLGAGVKELGKYAFTPEGNMITAALLANENPELATGLYDIGKSRQSQQQTQEIGREDRKQSLMKELRESYRDQRKEGREIASAGRDARKEERQISKLDREEKQAQTRAQNIHDQTGDLVSSIDDLLMGETETKTKDKEGNITITRSGRPRYEKGVGAIDARLGAYPESPKRFAINQEIKTLLAGKVLDTIAQMKNASRTGATGFGAMNEKELSLIEAAVTSLDPRLSDEAFGKNLNKLRAVLVRAQGLIDVPLRTKKILDSSQVETVGSIDDVNYTKQNSSGNETKIGKWTVSTPGV